MPMAEMPGFGMILKSAGPGDIRLPPGAAAAKEMEERLR